MTHALTRAALSAALMLAADKLKVGFILPYSGTFAALGTAIENGFKLYVAEQSGKLGGREIEYVKVDDESNPSKDADTTLIVTNAGAITGPPCGPGIFRTSFTNWQPAYAMGPVAGAHGHKTQ